MSVLGRWWRFNVVGMMGMVVQLCVLAGLNRVWHGHYLVASTVAIELTILHNFVWHVRYTWRDREAGWVGPLVRFQVSNGMVSLVGNLVLMRVLVQGAHVPVVLANVGVIGCCAVVNFGLGEGWAFAGRGVVAKVVGSVAGLVMVMCLGGVARAQVSAVTEKESPYTETLNTDCAYWNVFAGPAVSNGSSNFGASFLGGITFGQYFAKPFGKGISVSPQFELGAVGPLTGGHPLDGFVSVDEMLANRVPHRHLYPSATVGYTRVFATGNAVNFGLGFDFGKDEGKRLWRIEVRDYYLFTGPQQHVVSLRLGWGKFVPD